MSAVSTPASAAKSAVTDPTLGSKELRVVSHLLDSFQKPGFRRGMKIDDERTQAERYGVSRPTVRRALSRLEQHGVIIRRHGAGTFLQVMPDGQMIERILNESLPTEAGGAPLADRAQPRQAVVTETVTRRVAFLHDSWQSQTSLSPGSHVGSLLAGICAAAERTGVAVSIGSSRPSSQPIIHPDFSRQVYQPDAEAVIVSATVRAADLPRLERIPVPFVIVTQDADMEVPNAVIPDVHDGLRLAALQQIQGGHRRLAVLETKRRDEPARYAALTRYLEASLSVDQIKHVYEEDPLAAVMRNDKGLTGLIVCDALYLRDALRVQTMVDWLRGQEVGVGTFGSTGIDLGLPSWVGRVDFDAAELGRHAIEAVQFMLATGRRRIATVRVSGAIAESAALTR